MALYDFSVLCLLTSKENKGIKKKIRKDKRHGSGRGRVNEKSYFFPDECQLATLFFIKETC